MTRTARLPRAILCDVDGVLRLWDDAVTSRLEREYGVEPGTLASVAFAPDRLEPAVTGQVTDTEWRLVVAAALVEPLGSIERAASLVSDWSGPVGAVDEAVRDLLLEARRRGVRLVLVSNATTRLETDLAVLGLRQVVDGVVSSARLGAAKPDPRIYAESARVAGVPPEGCLYVDDNPSYVAAARSLGMTGVHYRGLDDLGTALRPLLALPPAEGSNGRPHGLRNGPVEG